MSPTPPLTETVLTSVNFGKRYEDTLNWEPMTMHLPSDAIEAVFMYEGKRAGWEWY